MNSVSQIFDQTIKTDHKVITEELAKSILKNYHITVPGYALVKSADEAARAAKKLGFPLVMKVVSPQILHKTDETTWLSSSNESSFTTNSSQNRCRWSKSWY